MHLKKGQLFIGDPNIEESCRFVSWYSEHLIEVFQDLDAGIPMLNIAIGTVKDEITTDKKNKEGLERIFCAGNVDFLILCRMYLSPYMDLFMRRRDVLFGQIGINAIGKEFNQRIFSTYIRITGDHDYEKFLIDEGWMDGDYSKYDKKLIVLSYGVHVLYKLVLVTPFYMNPDNKVHLNRVLLILKSLQQYVLILGSDVFLLDETLPSGVFGTAWLNCICEEIMEVLQFYFCVYCTKVGGKVLYPSFIQTFQQLYPFYDCVCNRNYGDDNFKFVRDDCRIFYTHDNITTFSKWIGMDITPAKKNESKLQFKPCTDLYFLKRSAVYCPDLDALIGRLDILSIARMLMYTDSNQPDWEDVILQQALRELAYHNEETFNKFIELFQIHFNITQKELRQQIYADVTYQWIVTKKSNDLETIIDQSDFYVTTVSGCTKIDVLNNEEGCLPDVFLS